MEPAARLKVVRFAELDREHWLNSALGVISHDERERVRLTPDAETRTQRAVGRALIRLFAAEANGGDPRRFEITLSETGKPLLPEVPNLDVSVAHSAGLVVAGACGFTQIGVDVEPAVSATSRQRRLAERLFDPSEVAALRDTPDANVPGWFASVWTIKEAVGKALGDGMVPALSGAVVHQHGDRFRLASVWRGPAPEAWTVHQLMAPGGTERIAVALPAPNVPLESASLLSLEEFAGATYAASARDT